VAWINVHEIRAFNRDWATVKRHRATRRVPGSVTVQAGQDDGHGRHGTATARGGGACRLRRARADGRGRASRRIGTALIKRATPTRSPFSMQAKNEKLK
jgi:hypothetical protein